MGHQTSRVDLLASTVHRRQTRAQYQSVEPNPVGGEERVGRHIKCLYAALERLKSGRDILRTPNVARNDLKAEWARDCLNLGQVLHGGGVTAINHYRGIISRKSSRRLPARSGIWADRPVTLPPGRARPATRLLPTGSATAANTIGMTDVAAFAATTFVVPCVTITSTLSRTNSAMISGDRSKRVSAQRYSIATLRPSIQPSSRKRRSKAAVH